MSMNIPKSRCPVQIALGAEVVVGEIFLAEYALDHAGPERPSDILNGHDAFFPVLQGDERLAMVARSKVLWMRISSAMYAEEPAFGADTMTVIPVRIRFEDAADLAGTVQFVAHPGRSRLADFLNDAPRFFALDEGSSIVLVNRDAAVSVEAERR